MSDVFISYKAEDRERIQPLVGLLHEAGLSVWWDAQIGSGERWRETIQQQLEQARCVLVAWSHGSVGPSGHFVRDEATWAQRRRVYLPIRLDDVSLPLGFGETQALSLIGWKGNRADSRLPALLAAVRAVIEHQPLPTLDIDAKSVGIGRRAALITVGSAAVVAAGASGWAWWRNHGADGDTISIAVLPFANLTGDPMKADVATGVSDELRNALITLPGIRLVGSVSSDAVSGLAAPKAAAKLGVRYIVAGSVRSAAPQLRINAQLIDGTTGVQKWSQSWNRPTGDMLAAQTDVASSAAELISTRLGVGGKPVPAAGDTTNGEARDRLLKAMTLYSTADDQASTLRALTMVNQALELDPRFPKALLMRANIEVYLAVDFATSSGDMLAGLARGERDIRRALTILPKWPPAHTNLGFVYQTKLDLRAAMQEYRTAQSLVPQDVQRWGDNLAELLIYCARTAEARQILQRLLAWDPLNADVYYKFALFHFASAAYEKAITASRRSLVLAPDRYQFRGIIAQSLLMLDRADEALAELGHLPDEDQNRLRIEAIALARTGEQTAAESRLAKLSGVSGDAINYGRAQVFAQLGRTDAALSALDAAWSKRDSGLLMLRVDPFLAVLRKLPAFKAAEARMDYPT